MLATKARKALRRLIFSTPLRDRITFTYPLNLTVRQLSLICQIIEKVKDVDGAIAEVGVERGITTVFINKYMDEQRIDKRYFAIDTFSGFCLEDIEGENPDLRRFYKNHHFQVSAKKWFDYTMTHNNIKRVMSIETDVNRFDLTRLGALSFVLLDVDLYRPTKKALRELFDVLTPNGVIAVHDCDPKVIAWKGAYQAYMEFMKEIRQLAEIEYGLGMVKKTASLS